MRTEYEKVPLDEPDYEEEDDDAPEGCMEAVRRALPSGFSRPAYTAVSTAGHAASAAADAGLETNASNSSCFDSVLRAVPSFRSHTSYRGVPSDDVDTGEDVEYALDSEAPRERCGTRRQNGDLELQYDDPLQLLSTAHGVHRVEVPFRARGSLRRIPATATRLVRRSRANGAISKSVKVLRNKAYKRLMAIVSVITIIALLSSVLHQANHITSELHDQRELLLDLKKTVELRIHNHDSDPEACTSRITEYVQNNMPGSPDGVSKFVKSLNSTANQANLSIALTAHN